MGALKTRKPLILIRSAEIQRNFSMSEAISAMREAFSELSAKTCFVPQRFVSSLSNGQLHLLIKPAAVDTKKRAAIKVITQKEKGVIGSIPAIVGVVMVLDTETGELLALIDGEYLTALRTGAASGLATTFFARPNSQTAAIYGCGAQGKTQLEAIAEVRQLKKVWVFARNKNHAQKFAKEMAEKLRLEIGVADNNRVLKECDIICTATNSKKPLFFADEIKPGVHINAIGSFKPDMQELDPQVLKKAIIFVDQKEPCLLESGDLIKPINDGILTAEHIRGEIGEFALGKITGRLSDKETTVFKSVGVAIQDFVVANEIYEKAIKNGFGQKVNLFE